MSEANLNRRAILQNYFLIIGVNTLNYRNSAYVRKVAYRHSIRSTYSHLLQTIHIYSSKLLPKTLNWNLKCRTSDESQSSR